METSFSPHDFKSFTGLSTRGCLTPLSATDATWEDADVGKLTSVEGQWNVGERGGIDVRFFS